MRPLVTAVVVLCAILSVAQTQTDSSKKPADQKKAQAAKPPEKKPAETAASAPEPAAAPEPKPAAKESSGDKEKEEHFDMTEVAPVVTHHQITVGGKTLKYTAAAGRLPIKRADGKIEAEMFFVAYTLDGQDASTRPLTFALTAGRDRRRFGCTWVR
jgi:carboxypeptidase C (cathepsin A)